MEMKSRNDLLATLDKTFDHNIKMVVAQMEAFPWENEEVYCGWLGQTFAMVQHTTRFLCYTASQFSFDAESHHAFCLNHLREEVGHENLAQKDLEDLGSTTKQYPPCLETDLMIQSQYYWISRTPFSHFAFFWVLEKLSTAYGPQAIARIRKSHGPTCASFLELHAQEDVGHVKLIRDKVEVIPTEHLPAVIKNVEQTGILYAQMLKSLAARYSYSHKAA